MQHIIKLNVTLILEVDSNNPTEVRSEANAMKEYIGEHLAEDLPGKWIGCTNVYGVEIK